MSLDALSVPLPGREVRPLETWKSSRPLPIDKGSRFEYGVLDLTFTYLGTRNRNGKDEAVISIDGTVRGAPGKDAQMGGKATGLALVDLATGQVSQTETRVTLEVDFAIGKGDKGEPGGREERSIRVIGNLVSRLERGGL